MMSGKALKLGSARLFAEKRCFSDGLKRSPRLCRRFGSARIGGAAARQENADGKAQLFRK
jgi:hypothetical protein